MCLTDGFVGEFEQSKNDAFLLGFYFINSLLKNSRKLAFLLSLVGFIFYRYSLSQVGTVGREGWTSDEGW